MKTRNRTTKTGKGETMKNFSNLAGAVLVSASLATGVQADTWKFSANDIEGNYHTENAQLFAADVERLSGGDLTIDVVSGAALLKRSELKRGVQRNIVAIGDVIAGALGNENAIFDADLVPLLATNFDEARRLWDVTRPMYEEVLAADGIMILWAEPWPAQGIYVTDPIESADALECVSFRAYNALTAQFAEQMGAVPTTIPSAEVSQAFSTGLVNAMITSPTTGVDTQAWDFAKYFYNIQAMVPKNLILMNTSMFESLSAETQAAVLEAAGIAETRGWEMGMAAQETALATLAENGMIIGDTPDVLKERLNAAAETILADWQARGGDAVTAIIDAYQE
jgi:TRAP-type C4-dicarboxylate transport system substrate-binding protein